MSKQILAITTCRVSTPEQELNNSLERQAEAVKRAAKELGATIPVDGQWSGSVSSKVGNNVDRKDLKQMLDYCKKNPAVRYLIVHEVDRFMRSIKELFYFEVQFEKVGVQVWYASQPELNTDDYKSKLFKALEAFKGEASNVERISKSISGQTTSLNQGKYPFVPKPGYMRGREKGIPEIHPVKGPALKKVLLDIASKSVTPTLGLINLNKSDFMLDGHSLYKMDKFRKICTDPFYAGVVWIDKQVKVRNENGLHEPLITLEQHQELIRIFSLKKKNQKGPRRNGNPEYPLSNIVTCELCVNDSSIPRFVGYSHGNGKNPNLVYHKYRCRACNRYLTREELHPKIEEHFNKFALSDEGINELLKSIKVVWKNKEIQAKQDIERTNNKIRHLKETIDSQAIAAIDPSNLSIKEEILNSVSKNKLKVEKLETELDKLTEKSDTDKELFMRFAFDFVDNMGKRFLEISHENRLRCKQLLFPAGFYLDANNKVYTPEISPLITLQTKKKDTVVSENSHLVRVKRLCHDLGEAMASVGSRPALNIL